jgi:hypothetical protein
MGRMTGECSLSASRRCCRLVTQLSQGYLQPDVGGENIPVAEGELSDLAGDEPLFKALYQWSVPCINGQLPVVCVCVCGT